MRRPFGRQRRQRGAALILFLTILVVGVAWYAVGALGKAPVATAEREVMTGRALQAAKQALLAYVAQYAARTDHDYPGRMPCPESLSSIGTANEGQAAGSCSNTTAEIGRLPWQTLGIDKPLDGAGEPLWYVISPGFRGVTPTTVINFGTPGQLAYFGDPDNPLVSTSVVAVIIAPGRPLDTTGDTAALPTWCPAKVNQNVATRNTASLSVANFLECGNATGNYRNPGNSQWTNDRAIAITAAEWADAIAPGVADRLQRQVAPALNDWRSTQSTANWGISFLPYASTFGMPSANDYCGDSGITEGLLPTARASSGTCSTAWSSGNVSGLLGVLTPGVCTPGATEMTCTFSGLVVVLGLFSARITATAPAVASSFRGAITTANVSVSSGSVSNFALSLDPSTGNALLSFDVSETLLALTLTPYTVRISNLPDAAILSDTRVSWLLANNWQQHTYYAISPANTANPGAATCPSGGGANCLTLDAVQDKQLILTLMGPRVVGTQTQPSAVPVDYLEAHTAGTTIYASQTVSPTFNDRLAACPFQHTGAPTALCN